MSSSEDKKVTLRSNDGVIFVVEESAAMQCQYISYMIEDGCASGVIPLPNVDGETLSIVLEYCKKHRHEVDDDDKEKKEELESWDQDFINIDMQKLLHVFMAANYLNAKGLLDLCAQKAADTIKGKMPEQVREAFGIKNDFTPEEEAEVRSKNSWAFEPVENN